MIPATRRLSRLEWASVALVGVLFVAFGGLVELRSAFLSRRMGDLGCYLRPAWAAQVGMSIYDIAEDNGWHYNYPPLYAILMMPLADPPSGYGRAGYVAYPVSVAIFYLLNIACMTLAVHLTARTLERGATDPAYREQPRFCRRWWALRMWPTLICLPPVALTLMRGQVNLQVLALLCGWLACAAAGRRALGGVLLGVAICIKVVPLYLLVYPLWRKDGRSLAGCALGLFGGLVVVPLAVLGPDQTVKQYGEYAHVFFGPLLKLSDDRSREEEILGMNATDSIGVKHAMHNWRYRDHYQRPKEYDALEEWTHRALGVLITLGVLWPLRRGRPAAPWTETHALGCLLLLMVAFSPISHVHYLAFCLPLVASLLFRCWHNQTTLRTSWPVALASLWFTTACALPSVPGLEELRDLCVPLFGALPLGALAMVDLWRTVPTVAVTVAPRLAA